MIDPVPEAISYKNQAKNARRSTPPDFERAETLLKQAVRKLEAVPLNPSPAPFGKLEKGVAMELADCWGSLGGTYRAWGKLKEAYKYYAEGLKYESDPRLPANSYNLVNRLLVRLAMNPAEDREVECTTETFPEQLQRTRLEVARQARGPRKGDMWVHADDLVLSLIAGDPAAAKKARDEFDRLAILEHAYKTTRDVLMDLAGRQTLSIDQRDALQQEPSAGLRTRFNARRGTRAVVSSKLESWRGKMSRDVAGLQPLWGYASVGTLVRPAATLSTTPASNIHRDSV